MTRAVERDLMRTGIQTRFDALEGDASGDGRAITGKDRQAALTLIQYNQQLAHETRGAQDTVRVWHKARLRGFSELYAAVTGKSQTEADNWLHRILDEYRDPTAAPSAESTARKLRDAAGKRAREAALARGDCEPLIEFERVRQGGKPHAALPSINDKCVSQKGPVQLDGQLVGKALAEYLKFFRKAKS